MKQVPRNSWELGHEAMSAFMDAFEEHYEHHGYYESFAHGWNAMLRVYDGIPEPPIRKATYVREDPV